MDTGEIERELEELENRIERLRALYEQYFMGIEKMEPAIPRKDAERRIWVLRREQIRNTGLRFKFQMLIQRYNTFQQYWGRVTREIENGTYRRDVMRAAIRFGEKDALTLVGKKRAQQYKTLLENQRALREGGRKLAERVLADGEEPREEAAPEASWGDITEVMDADDAPTPESVRSPVAPPPPPTPLAAAPTTGAEPPPAASAPTGLAGLRWSQTPPRKPPPPPGSSEATRVAGPPPLPRRPLPAAPPPMGAAPSPIVAAPPPAPEPLAPPPPAGPAANPRRRVAELAAEMRARKSEQGEQPAHVASLDLDFDADMTLPQPMLPSPLLPNGGGAPAPAPKRRRSSRSMKAVQPPAAPPPVAAVAVARPVPPPPVAPPPPKISEQEVPSWAETTQPSMRRKLAAAAASQGATQPSAPAPRPPPPKPSEPTAAEPAAAARKPPQDLSDQRIRQIYAKYVETKRAANESTAGVTYERLAESLRSQANKLRTSHPSKSVDYEVVTKDGKTMLKPILR